MIAPRRREEGYVLISAIWMLALAGAIVAFLVLESVEASRQTRTAGELLKTRLALDAVLESIVADRIINGNRSKWSRAPEVGTIMIDGMAVQVRSTDESTRIDINRADMQALDLALRHTGLREQKRQIVLERIALARGQRQPVRTMAEMASILMHFERTKGERCLPDIFTAGAGTRSAPLPSLHLLNATAPPETLRPGAIQRLELASPQGMERTVLVRIIGQKHDAVAVVDWNEGQVCE